MDFLCHGPLCSCGCGTPTAPNVALGFDACQKASRKSSFFEVCNFVVLLFLLQRSPYFPPFFEKGEKDARPVTEPCSPHSFRSGAHQHHSHGGWARTAGLRLATHPNRPVCCRRSVGQYCTSTCPSVLASRTVRPAAGTPLRRGAQHPTENYGVMAPCVAQAAPMLTRLPLTRSPSGVYLLGPLPPSSGPVRVAGNKAG